MRAPVLEADGSGIDPFLRFTYRAPFCDVSPFVNAAYDNNCRYSITWLGLFKRRIVITGTVPNLNRVLSQVWEQPGVAETVAKSAGVPYER